MYFDMEELRERVRERMREQTAGTTDELIKREIPLSRDAYVSANALNVGRECYAILGHRKYACVIVQVAPPTTLRLEHEGGAVEFFKVAGYRASEDGLVRVQSPTGVELELDATPVERTLLLVLLQVAAAAHE